MFGLFEGSKEKKDLYESLFVVRQPVFDPTRQIWGYELRFRSGASPDMDIDVNGDEQDISTAKLIADGVAVAQDGINENMRMFISINKHHLEQNTIEALPKELCVANLLMRKADAEVLEMCTALKEAGYMLAVSIPASRSLLNLAGIIRLNVKNMSEAETIKAASILKDFDCELFAEGIQDEKVFDLVKSNGFSLFQGEFFSKPVVVSGRKVRPAAASRLQLVHEISVEDYEVSYFSKLITTDPSLSYRLLAFINSAYFSFRHKITSVSQAISLLGQRPLKLWLMMAVMSDLEEEKTPSDVYLLSVQRGIFFEQLVNKMDNPPVSPDTLLLVGLFSKLDVLLGLPFDVIIEHLPLEETIINALTGQESPLSRWLGLVEDVEQERWGNVDSFLKSQGLKSKDAAICYNLATIWAYNMTQGGVTHAA